MAGSKATAEQLEFGLAIAAYDFLTNELVAFVAGLIEQTVLAIHLTGQQSPAAAEWTGSIERMVDDELASWAGSSEAQTLAAAAVAVAAVAIVVVALVALVAVAVVVVAVAILVAAQQRILHEAVGRSPMLVAMIVAVVARRIQQGEEMIVAIAERLRPRFAEHQLQWHKDCC